MRPEVFPAYAGMFRPAAVAALVNVRFPRIRGDVPQTATSIPNNTPFSPHTRGCSAGVCFAGQEAGVFPAYAGMFLGPAVESDC